MQNFTQPTETEADKQININILCEFLKKHRTLQYRLFCAFVSLPMAVLGFMTPLDDQNGEYVRVTNVDEFSKLWLGSAWHLQCFAVAFFVVSEVSFYAVTEFSLSPAFDNTVNYFKRLQHCEWAPEIKDDNEQRGENHRTINASFYFIKDTIYLAMGVGTGLIFGALGAFAFEFLGTEAIWVSYALCFFVFGSSRYSALHDFNFDLSSITKDMHYHHPTKPYALALGTLFSLYSLLPIGLIYGVYGVIGTERLADLFGNKVDIGNSHHYQNWQSILLGLCCAFATNVFFALYDFKTVDHTIEAIIRIKNNEELSSHQKNYQYGKMLLLFATAVISNLVWFKPVKSVLDNNNLFFDLGKASPVLFPSILVSTSLSYFLILLKIFMLGPMRKEAEKANQQALPTVSEHNIWNNEPSSDKKHLELSPLPAAAAQL